MKLKLQKYVELDLDAVFETFYDTILSNADFSTFFPDKTRIRFLIEKQKQFLLDSISLPDSEIERRYIELGELHDQIRVPFVDYMAATNILERGLINALVKRNESWEVLEATFNFFKAIRSYTAKGYLNKLLEADSKDIDHYLTHVQRTSDNEFELATNRIIWLKGIIHSIKTEDRFAAPALEIPPSISDKLMKLVKGDAELARYATDMAARMEQTARNIFYFMDNGSYEEVLTLYRELMSVYKLTLMLMSLVTVVESDKALLSSASKLESALDNMIDMVFVSDADGRIVVFNNIFAKFHQFKNKDECGTALPEFPAYLNIYTVDEKPLAVEQSPMRRALRGETGSYFELILRQKDTAESKILRYNYSPIRNSDNEIIGTVVTGRDITAQKQAEHQLRIAATAFETQQGMVITDANNNILHVNNSFIRITGYSAEEAIGQSLSMLRSSRHDKNFYANIWEQINQQNSWAGEIWNRRKNGDIYPAYTTITAVMDMEGKLTNYVCTQMDISSNKAAEQEIERLAFYDPLTGLANRRLFTDKLRQGLNSYGCDGALLYIDIDNFKILNDSYGHRLGDLLLQEVATRLRGCVHEEDIVARLGGDEFVVMLVGLSKYPIKAVANAELTAYKILNALSHPYLLEERNYHCTSSVGITIFEGQQEDKLLQQADIAMYHAKKVGGNTLCFFDEKMHDTIKKRAALEKELYEAIEQQQFQLYYQIQTNSIGYPVGAEVLIRWNHPERGLMSPIEFIPLAEETGLILPIGHWVLETTCAQLKIWQQHPFTQKLELSVNVSAKQFYQAEFVSQIQAIVYQYAIDPKLLKLELTESLLLDSLENTIAIMNSLRVLGIRFSLDDFGTGYSSLQYLKKLPLDQLKIDQSFVRDIVTNPYDKSIVRTIIAMAQNMGLTVIAEGVETEDQLKLLLNKGCTHFQGYLFGEPIPVEQFELLIKTLENLNPSISR